MKLIPHYDTDFNERKGLYLEIRGTIEKDEATLERYLNALQEEY